MRLERLSFRDSQFDWELAPIEFFPDLTLLVGISGVGKTRILRAIETLLDVVKGSEDDEFWGLSWEVAFSSDDGSSYSWKGQFEDRNSESRPSNGDDMLEYFAWLQRGPGGPYRPKVKSESLVRDGTTIVSRDEHGIQIKGKMTPKLSPYESVLKILSEEDAVSPASRAWRQLLFVDHESDEPSPRVEDFSDFDSLLAIHPDLDSIRSSHLPTRLKLALAHENCREVYDEIVDQFKNAFPYVEDVQFYRLQLPGFRPQAKIRELGVDKWIPEHRISSGMRRTLMHLSRMALWPDGMVVLIDEFENSMGVNCIDFVTENLVNASDRLQFIITSHHPYIINNIDVRNWKIVTRSGSIVSTQNATAFGLEESSHEAFIKLMNLRQFHEGIAVT